MHTALKLFLIGGAFTAVLASGARSDTVVRLKAQDLSAQTSKWVGKTVETTMSCFYADKDEFRCVGGGARVDFSSLQPEAERTKIESNCDTISKSAKSVCTVRFQFVYQSNRKVDTGGLMGQMTVIEATDDAGTIMPKGKR